MIKHFIDIKNFSLKEINSILLTAKKMKTNKEDYQNIFKSLIIV